MTLAPTGLDPTLPIECEGGPMSAWTREFRWIASQPAAVLRAYLDALTWLDVPPRRFLAIQAAVLARLPDPRG